MTPNPRKVDAAAPRSQISLTTVSPSSEKRLLVLFLPRLVGPYQEHCALSGSRPSAAGGRPGPLALAQH